MSRRYMEVSADMQPDGAAIPISIFFNGSEYLIEEVLRIVPMSTTKKGGACHRYDVIIDGSHSTLYFEYSDSHSEARRWYVEHE